MKSNPSEYSSVIEKLLEKTRQRRVEWERAGSDSFRSSVGSGVGNSFSFTISSSEDAPLFLVMADASQILQDTIFRVTANDLPTSPEEERVSQMIEELYELARKQALKVDEKLELAASLLDRV